MSWDDRILEFKGVLSDGVRLLIEQQKETWPMLRESIIGLDQAQYKRLRVYGTEIYAQFNPKRIVSTAAEVDARTISRRPCFLCIENLPAEERGIAFDERFVILCNPYPVLRDHLVIASRDHAPQTILGNFAKFLDLARELGNGWFVLYNGPRCGASAPDHLHFQACSRERIPILREVAASDGVDAFPMLALRALVNRNRNRQRLIRWLDLILSILSQDKTTPDEPMINIVAAFEKDEWTVIVYPRQKHRPSCYYADDEKRLLVSPAAIDLAGVVVIPNPDHFARISAKDIERIYDEVLLDDEQFDEVLERVPDEL
jgi:hypothetical protein